jgi:L-ascorbate metabolism protein UlaG (beta-lactamase superfamily)
MVNCAVRRLVVGNARGDLPRQKTVVRGRPGQAVHVVVGKPVGSRRVVHALDPAYQVVDVIHLRRIRILLLAQPVQRVQSVGRIPSRKTRHPAVKRHSASLDLRPQPVFVGMQRYKKSNESLSPR